MGKIRLEKDQKKCVCLFCGRLGQDLVRLIQCQTNRDPHGKARIIFREKTDYKTTSIS